MGERKGEGVMMGLELVCGERDKKKEEHRTT